MNSMILAAMSDSDMVRIVVRLIIVACIVGGLWWLIDYCVTQPQLNKGLHIVLVLLAFIWFARELLAIGF